MSVRDPLIEGEGEFHSYVEDTEIETGYSVAHLDLFLSRVYNYYLGKGFLCIILTNALNLITFAFTIALATFLVSFVDYSSLAHTLDWRNSIHISVHRIHPITFICDIVFAIFWLWQLLQFLRNTKHNYEIKQFYSKRLEITEKELQTIEWREVVQKIGTVKRLCRMKDFLSPLDVAARIMRKENYLIALVNKNILDLHIPFPFLRKHVIMIKAIEWGLTYSLFNLVFDEHQTIEPDVLDDVGKRHLAVRLRKRFIVMGLLSFCLSPFIFLYLLVYFFFKYSDDIRNTPGSVLGAREWTPLARWKFREYNELPHYLQNRLSYSIKSANEYIDQFPMNAVAIVAKFVEFIAGAGLAVLLAIGFWDDNILTAEIYGKGAIWYAGVLGTIVAVCRSLIPDEHAVFDPQKSLDIVSSHTHYWPPEWKSAAHTQKVREEVSSLFQFKAVMFLQEILGVIFAPFVLAFSLSGCSNNIIDFFNKNTVEVPGVGFVCAYSSFTHEDKLDGEDTRVNVSAPAAMRGDGKLEQSILTFKAHNPKWEPDARQGGILLDNLHDFMSQPMTQASADPSDLASSPLNHPSPAIRNFLQESMTAPTLMSQSLSVLRPAAASVTFAPTEGQTIANMDPNALAFLHRVHQKFKETKATQATPPRPASYGRPSSTSSPPVPSTTF